mmetsp:Transcript_39864/g.63877  ORF Transcript_39864/g.63877 Transcript_39864/m.63877 type:complete len:205 (+) Transcript_39864:237-851(+)
MLREIDCGSWYDGGSTAMLDRTTVAGSLQSIEGGEDVRFQMEETCGSVSKIFVGDSLASSHQHLDGSDSAMGSGAARNLIDAKSQGHEWCGPSRGFGEEGTGDTGPNQRRNRLDLVISQPMGAIAGNVVCHTKLCSDGKELDSSMSGSEVTSDGIIYDPAARYVEAMASASIDALRSFCSMSNLSPNGSRIVLLGRVRKYLSRK